jgi:N-acetyl sugar amidotransferase
VEDMEYCKRCVIPKNAKPIIMFDEHGICSACRVMEGQPKVNWEERKVWLQHLLEEYKAKARANNNPYDCIIPVSGGKDSHYQTYIIKEVYGLNPLLVCYNHLFNPKKGLRNLTNLVKQFNCDLLRVTSNPEAVRKLSIYSLKKMGDITWHYHAGIMTLPAQIAVRYKIPLVVWGENLMEGTGMFGWKDMIEFTKKVRREHHLRGFDAEDFLEDPMAQQEGIAMQDLGPFFYPSDEEIEQVGVRGVFLGNYMPWDYREQVKLMVEKYGFETALKRERTFNIYAKLDDVHDTGTHDYLKYLKFGYGRATDDACVEIRLGRMTREEGIEMVKKYDHVRPSDLGIFLRFSGMTEQEFEDSIESMRDPKIWEKRGGKWVPTDSVVNHKNDAGVKEARLPYAKNWIPQIPSRQPKGASDMDDTEYTYI